MTLASERKETRGRRRRQARQEPAEAPGPKQLPWRRLANPFSPMEPLSADQVEEIHLASLSILEQFGIEVMSAQARALLQALEALDAQGRITAHGRAMAELPLHPRLAHMVLRGQALGRGALACEVAALLGERDLLGGARAERDADVRTRIELLRDGGGDRRVDAATRRRVLQVARRLQKELNIGAQAVEGPRRASDP